MSLVSMTLFTGACAKEEAPPPATPAATAAPAKRTPPPAPPTPPDVAAPPATATKLPSGVTFEVLTPGTGTEHPGDYDKVKAQFSVWSTEGKLLMTSFGRAPGVLPMDKIATGWKEALAQTVIGEKARFWIPEAIGLKSKTPVGTNVLEVEILAIDKGQKPPDAPEDVKAPPADARKLPDGLAIKTLKKGTGTVHPTLTDRVSVNYAGWTTDGKNFDFSKKDAPVTFGLANLINGWKEGIPELVEGETARMWIPEELAYKGQPGKPQGMLVFDIELLKINPPLPPTPAVAPAAPGIAPAGMAHPAPPAVAAVPH